MDLGGTRVSDHLNSGPPSGGGDRVSNKVSLCSRWPLGVGVGKGSHGSLERLSGAGAES